MKRIIYTLTAFISAAAVVLFIVEYMVENESGDISFNAFRDPLIAVLPALCVLSIVQLKKHTPRIMLMLCGYVFIACSAFRYGYLGGLLGTLLLLAASLTPAIYELSRYGMMVRNEPKAPGSGRWRWLLKAAIALIAFRVLPFILQLIIDIRINSNINILESYPADIMGLSALVCFAVFCGLMSRRTSGLYRAFFTGCILFDAVQTVFIDYNSFFTYTFRNSMASTLFVFLEILYTLFVLLILIHAFLSGRDVPVSPEHSDIAPQAEIPAA